MFTFMHNDVNSSPSTMFTVIHNDANNPPTHNDHRYA